MSPEEALARVEIAALLALYNTAGDSGRREEFATVFSEDAVLDAPGLHLEGRARIVDGLFSGAAKAAFVRHHLDTSTVTFIEPALARGRTYFQVITEVGLDHSGLYADRYRMQDDGWKIAHRIVSIDYISNSSKFFTAHEQ